LNILIGMRNISNFTKPLKELLIILPLKFLFSHPSGPLYLSPPSTIRFSVASSPLDEPRASVQLSVVLPPGVPDVPLEAPPAHQALGHQRGFVRDPDGPAVAPPPQPVLGEGLVV